MKYLLKRQFSDTANIFRSLLTIYGIGYITAKAICNRFAVSPVMSFKNLSQAKLVRLNAHLSHDFVTESTLRRDLRKRLNDHKIFGSYKGHRLKQGLPMNGQRTHTNAKTIKRLLRKHRNQLSLNRKIKK